MPDHRAACHARPVAHPFLLCTLDRGHEGPHTAWHNWRNDEDDTPTVQFPPIRETIRRRPPAPAVAELTGRVELAEALMAELRAELAELRAVDDDDDEDLADVDCTAVVQGRPCEWLHGSPCLGYGSEGCGMKAQERRR